MKLVVDGREFEVGNLQDYIVGFDWNEHKLVEQVLGRPLEGAEGHSVGLLVAIYAVAKQREDGAVDLDALGKIKPLQIQVKEDEEAEAPLKEELEAETV